MSLHSVIQQLYDLNVGIIGQGEDRHERPHKPVLLLAVLDLMDRGADTGRVVWSDDLRAAFTRIFAVVRKRDDRASPQLPFYYMRSDGFWTPMVLRGGARQPLTWEPRVKEPSEVFADLSPELVALLGDRQNRQCLREALVSRYFAEHREVLLGTVLPVPCAAEAPAAYGGPQPGRSAAFRKKILEIYDHRCTACGIQIRIGSPPLSLVEAAHLLPFAESWNDHPTNGLALCKNHHWAMDNHLIAPSPEGVWRHSSRIIPHRSRGEQDLAELDGRRVIPPTELAFRPARAGLEYRYQKMIEAQA